MSEVERLRAENDLLRNVVRLLGWCYACEEGLLRMDCCTFDLRKAYDSLPAELKWTR